VPEPTTKVYETAAATTVCTDRDGADAATTGTAVNSLVATQGRETAYVAVNLSAASGGATCTVAVLLYDQRSAFIGLAPPGVQTVTSSTTYKDDSDDADYEAPVASFDLCGAVYYEVRTGDASPSGTRTVKTWAA
jgi:hypothetical protein